MYGTSIRDDDNYSRETYTTKGVIIDSELVDHTTSGHDTCSLVSPWNERAVLVKLPGFEVSCGKSSVKQDPPVHHVFVTLPNRIPCEMLIGSSVYDNT